VLRGVSAVDPSTTFLGHHLRIPVLAAPIGSLQRFTPGGGTAAVAAAAEFGVVPVISSATEPLLEETAASADAVKMFQLYIRGDLEWTRQMIGRIEGAGYGAFVLTVDTAVPSRRERPLISVGPATAPPRPAGEPNYQAQLTWESVDEIHGLTSLPFMIKGIQTAADAALAVEHGADVVWVSNHGGRQLDHARGSMDTLPEIVAAAGGRAEIVVDGGVHRGSDILKAIALGANAVAIGRLQAWGLAAAGADGFVRVLEILEAEMQSAMGLLGVTTLDQLGPAYVGPSEPVTAPHEMSSWPNIPGGRIL
jgi:glycolate oxidase